jgi:hypothetical protein
MLHAITWKQFAAVMTGGGLLYYLIVLFTCYRRELRSFFNPQQKTAPPAPARQAVFGAAQVNEEEMNLVDENELTFAESDPDEVQEQLLGGIADFMQELKVLLRLECTKADFLMMLGILVSKYSDAASLRYAEPIALYILEEGSALPFDLSKDEIEEALTPNPDNNEN